ncbi:MAG TPA: ABC transporter ATP-binding protein [Kofleriaceae bacterium]|nr:ABC transporter ATP-binding protein [Kofleriaceae bacterium]
MPQIHDDLETLRLERVTRRFGRPGGPSALAELSLTVQRGELIALLGPSGCGKSTALNCIAGLLPLSAGAIWLNDRRLDLLPPEQRGFGMVFQSYALFPHMTVAANVQFGLMMRGVPAAERRRRTARALAMVQLEGHEHKLPGQLSGGQQQRVAIARAIVVEPRLVLMDEPLSNLDAKLRLEMRAEIRRIHRELGRTTIYVTHDQDEALSMADRIVVLQDGAAQQIGTPEEVYAQPANLHVARFMGYRNLLELDVDARAGDQVTLRGPWGALRGTVQQELAGSRAIAAIRPDEIAVVKADADSADPAGNAGNTGNAGNAIRGEVDGVEYYGRDCLIEIVATGGQRLYARSHARIERGAAVHAVVPPERVLVYPASPR